MAQLLRAYVAAWVVGLIAASSSWSYSDPPHWSDDYETCGGSKQSPINIETEYEEYNGGLGTFSRSGWGSSSDGSAGDPTYTMVNNGHSLQVNVDSSHSHISGAGLSGNYETAQLHFHWGSDSSHGSEHEIDGNAYPMELHIVHFKESYGSISNALNYPDGLAVMGFLFRVSRDDNENYDHLLDYFSRIRNAGDQTSIPSFALNDLIPSDIRGYHRYAGSLTTPPCSEVVTWSIFHNTIPLSENQIAQFRRLYEDSAGHTLKDNFRPTQPLNGRTVYTSRNL